ncbi:MFS transporter [Bacillus tianshenii]|nr:MFS transporter [Bacillus tianshenii]
MVQGVATTEKYTPRDRKFWMALSALGVASILTFSNLYMVHPILPAFVKEFHISPTTASLSLSLSVLSMICGLLYFGFLSDRSGRVGLMKVTLLLSILPLFIIPFLSSFWLILVFRFIQGFFIAGLPAAAIAYIGEEFERRSVGIGITVYIATNAIGGMGGRVLVGFVSDYTSWQTSILVLAGIGLVFYLLFYFQLPPSRGFEPSTASMKDDLTGMFVHLTNPLLIPAFLLGITLQTSFTGIWTYLPFYLGEPPFSLSIKEISLTYLAYSMGVIGSPIAGRLTDRIGHNTFIMSGAIILIVGSALTMVPSVFVISVGLCVLCLGFFIAHSMAAALVNMRAEHHKGGASSLYLVSYYIGVASGGTVTGFIWDGFGWIGIACVAVLLLPIIYWLNAYRKAEKLKQKVNAPNMN